LKVEHIHEAVRSGEMVDYCDVGVTHAEIPGLLLHSGGSGGGGGGFVLVSRAGRP
jgi:hypothetical protein